MARNKSEDFTLDLFSDMDMEAMKFIREGDPAEKVPNTGGSKADGHGTFEKKQRDGKAPDNEDNAGAPDIMENDATEVIRFNSTDTGGQDDNEPVMQETSNSPQNKTSNIQDAGVPAEKVCSSRSELITNTPADVKYSEERVLTVKKDGIAFQPRNLVKTKTLFFQPDILLKIKKRAAWNRMSLMVTLEFACRIDMEHGGIDRWANMPQETVNRLMEKNGTYGRGLRCSFHISEEVCGYIKEIARYTALKETTIIHALIEEYFLLGADGIGDDGYDAKIVTDE